MTLTAALPPSPCRTFSVAVDAAELVVNGRYAATPDVEESDLVHVRVKLSADEKEVVNFFRIHLLDARVRGAGRAAGQGCYRHQRGRIFGHHSGLRPRYMLREREARFGEGHHLHPILSHPAAHFRPQTPPPQKTTVQYNQKTHRGELVKAWISKVRHYIPGTCPCPFPHVGATLRRRRLRSVRAARGARGLGTCTACVRYIDIYIYR